MLKECALAPFTAPPALPSTQAVSQHGKVVWAHAVSLGRNWKKDGLCLLQSWEGLVLS